MVRHKLVLFIDVADDDQSDPEAIVETVKKWVERGSKADEEEFGTYPWPKAWRVEHRGEGWIREEAETEAPNGGSDERTKG